MSAREQLFHSATTADSLVCVGLDPRPEQFPRECLDSSTSPDEAVLTFYTALLTEIADSGLVPGAFKPNIAYFHRLDNPRASQFGGSTVLARLLDRIRNDFPGVPVILDAKRGDIGETSAAYAEEVFSAWGADAVTISPFMGDDSVAPFLDAARTQDRWVYILNRTSNIGAQRIQDLTADGKRVYEHVAQAISEWQEYYGTAGAVIGATAPGELKELLGLHRSRPVPVLIPGVGAQGGSATEVMAVMRAVQYPPELVRVNISRAISAPWGTTTAPPHWRELISRRYREVHQALSLPVSAEDDK